MSTDTANNNYTTPVNTKYSSFLYHFINESSGVPIYPYITAVTGHRSFAQPGEAEGIPGFTEQDIKEAFKAQLRPMAELWRDSCNGTAPFIFMTGMADGADQIAAEAALELDPDLNIKVVAVLPMAEDIYKNTIENKDRFNRLMQSASFKFTLPLTKNNIGFDSELARICDETEYRRKEQYAVLGHFLAAHSHVLFAFWDGIPSTNLIGGTADTVFYKLNGNMERQNHGDLLTFSSVGPVVHLLIPRNNADNRNNPLASDLDMSSIPIFFLTRNVLREKVHFSPDNQDFNRSYLNSDIRCRSNVAENPELNSIIERIGNMNKDSVSFFDDESFIKSCKKSYEELVSPSGPMKEELTQELFQNRFDHLNDFEDRDTRLLVEHYAVADQVALKYQKKSGDILKQYKIFICLFFLVYGLLTTLWTVRVMNWAKDPNSCFHFVWGVYYEPAQVATELCQACNRPLNEEPKSIWAQYEFSCLPTLSFLYLLSVVILVLIYRRALNQKYHYRYHRFRALAEALRIQIYWRIAGMNDCVSAYYRSHQIQETEWIRAAINSIDVFLDYPFDSGFKALPEERVKFTIDYWVIGQRNYYTKKTNAKKKEQKGLFVSLFTHRYTLYFLAFIYFSLPFKGDFFNISGSLLSRIFNSTPLLIAFVTLGMLVTLLTACCLLSTTSLKFNRSKAEAKRFEQILFPFDRATLLLNSEKDSDKQQMILRQLGTEAISENVNWLLTVGEQDLALPR